MCDSCLSQNEVFSHFVQFLFSPLLYLPIVFFFFLPTANLCTSPVENVSIQKYSNGIVYKNSEFSFLVVLFRSLQQQEP